MTSWRFESKDNRTIIIRHASPKDARNLHDGFCSVVEEGKWLPTFNANANVSDWVSWIQRTFHSREILLIAEVDGKYAGHVTIQPEEWMASQHVGKLGIVVIKQYRGIGVGRGLMICVEEKAREERYEKVVLSTFEDNEIAKNMYESLGYRMVGIRKRHFKMSYDYIDELLFEKEIRHQDQQFGES
jgi:ribosomal protein S18 acetylase RimI-like enzyme